MDLRGGLKGFAADSSRSHALTFGIAEGALTEAQAANMAGLFPAIGFQFLEAGFDNLPSHLDILFTAVDGAAPERPPRRAPSACSPGTSDGPGSPALLRRGGS